MTEITSKEMYKTSLGTAFIVDVDKDLKLKVGDEVVINGTQYKIKDIKYNSRPYDTNLTAIFV